MNTECRNGHDLAVLGVYVSAKGKRKGKRECIACRHIRQNRYMRSPKGKATQARFPREKRELINQRHQKTAKYKARRSAYKSSIAGQLIELRAQLKYRIRSKEARVAELETMLNDHA